jgi:hypothetical protein
MPTRGDICRCSLGTLGVVTEDEKQEVTYRDGNTAEAYVGVHVRDHPEYDIEKGDPWSSRDPEVVVSFERLDNLHEACTTVIESLDQTK